MKALTVCAHAGRRELVEHDSRSTHAPLAGVQPHRRQRRLGRAVPVDARRSNRPRGTTPRRYGLRRQGQALGLRALPRVTFRGAS